jgi:general secretion pathway protein B
VIVAQAAGQAAPVTEETRDIATPSVATRSSTPALTKGEDVRSKKGESAVHDVKPAAPAKAPLAAAKTQATKKSDPKKEAIQVKEAAQDLHPKKSVLRAEPEKSANAQAAPSDATSSQHADTQIAALRDLPESIQRSIPAISIGGYIYSPNPAGRSMLLNNRLVREGEQAASGVILEKMMPKEAVLNYQGQRFRLPY